MKSSIVVLSPSPHRFLITHIALGSPHHALHTQWKLWTAEEERMMLWGNFLAGNGFTDTGRGNRWLVIP